MDDAPVTTDMAYDRTASMELLRVQLLRCPWVWLSPAGFVPASVPEDNDRMPSDGLDAASDVYVSGVRSSRQDVDQCYESCNEDENEYGRSSAEWHRYDMAEGEHTHYVNRERFGLYALGWVFLQRSVYETGRPDTRVLEANGAADVLDILETDLRELAGSVGRVLRRNDADPIRVAGFRRKGNAPRALLEPALDGTFIDEDACMLWERVLADMDRDGYGWLSPDGELVTCLLHEHLDVLMHRGEQVERFVNLRDLRKHRDAAWSEWRADGMHLGNQLFMAASSLDAVEQDSKAGVIEALYNDGWLRLAQVDMRSQGEDMLVAEGRKLHLRGRRHLLSSIAYHLGLDYTAQVAGTSNAQPGIVAR